jgi:protein TonB
MSAAEAVPGGFAVLEETANERLKRTFDSWFWGSMILATLVHFGAFSFAPEMTAEDFSFESEELEAITMPPEVEIPPPPQAIARPATPVIAEAAIDEDITIAPTTFEDNPVDDLPPPPDEIETDDIASAPTFTPFTVAPSLQNVQEVQRALVREYPSVLRDSGVGGRVTVWFFIDEEGRVQQTQINESSGYDALDQAALNVAEVYQFSPALNRENRVQVWVSLPITFQVQ